MNERPLGVTLLCLLLVGGALLSIVTALMSITDLAAGLREAPALALFVMLSLIALILLGLAAGIGMWLGKPSGWWLAAFYYVYSVARNANALISIPGLTQELGEPESGVGSYYLQYAGRVVLAAVVLVYLYRESVLDYFGLSEMRRLKSILILGAAAVAVLLLGTVVASMF